MQIIYIYIYKLHGCCAFIHIMQRNLLILGASKLKLVYYLTSLFAGYLYFHKFWHAGLALTCYFWVFRHAHPGSPYVFGLVGVDHDLDFPEPMPVVGMNYCTFICGDCFIRCYALKYLYKNQLCVKLLNAVFQVSVLLHISKICF